MKKVIVEVMGPNPPCHRCTAVKKNVEAAARKLSSDGLKVVVKNPGNCNVGDEACKWRCPNGALSFPSREELRAQLTSLRQMQGKKGSDAGEATGGEM
jgi:NAD-dependent dihydropyrimidine dehydrogenase PreA subunit